MDLAAIGSFITIHNGTIIDRVMVTTLILLWIQVRGIDKRLGRLEDNVIKAGLEGKE